jgi:hypothetical protein
MSGRQFVAPLLTSLSSLRPFWLFVASAWFGLFIGMIEVFYLIPAWVHNKAGPRHV